MSSLKYKTNNGYEPLPAMVVRKTNAENGNGIGTCSTSSGTALTVSLTNYELVINGFVAVTFENDVPAGATLNINSKGAKPIYYKGSAITADTIKADDTALFSYDGTNYVLISSGGSGSIPQEELTISLASNQTADTGLNGATITVTQTGVVEPLYSGTWAGTNIVISIDAGIEYTVTVGSVTGYDTPAAQTYSSLGNNSRTATFTYNTEVVTVTCTTEDNVAVTGHKVTINNVEYTLDSTGIVSAKVAYGTTYTVSLGSWDGYTTPATQSFTAGQVSRSVSMQWKAMYVDLGLPSGIKWAKGNIVSDGNGGYKIGAETDYGVYSSWGNITAHSDNGTTFVDGYNFDSNNYSLTPGYAISSSSYPNSGAVYTPNSGYDIARELLGGSFRTPSSDEIQELVDNCTSEWKTKDGINGKELTSNINGAKIFIPAGGRSDGTSIYNRTTFGYMKTSSLHDQDIAYVALIIERTINCYNTNARYIGVPVRPVI